MKTRNTTGTYLNNPARLMKVTETAQGTQYSIAYWTANGRTKVNLSEKAFNSTYKAK